MKNIGMGCGSRAGKMEQHNDGKPYVEQRTCVGCRACAKHLRPRRHPPSARTTRPPSTTTSAWAAAGASAVCPMDAIQCMYDEAPAILNCKMAEYAKAVVDGRPQLPHQSWSWTCPPTATATGKTTLPIVPDVGMFASFDPVALDQACIDAVLAQPQMPNSVIRQAARPASCE